MKIIFNVNEIKTITKVIEKVSRSGEEMLGITDLFFGDNQTLDENAIKEFNEKYTNVASITKTDDEYVFWYNEEIVSGLIELTGDAVIESFDVIKYAIKTFMAFKATKIDVFINKIENLIKGK